MSRDRLPNRRFCESVHFDHWGIPFEATLGYYQDRRLGEIFLNAGKLTSTADILAKEAAIVASFALQFGASLDDMRAAMPRTTEGEPEGPLGKLMDILGDTSK